MTDKKTTVLVFTENNARILTNPPDLEFWKTQPNAIINPVRPKGVPLHFLKLVDGKIEEMTRPEKLQRLAHQKRYGVINDIPSANQPAARRRAHWTDPLRSRANWIMFGAGFFSGLIWSLLIGYHGH